MKGKKLTIQDLKITFSVWKWMGVEVQGKLSCELQKVTVGKKSRVLIETKILIGNKSQCWSPKYLFWVTFWSRRIFIKFFALISCPGKVFLSLIAIYDGKIKCRLLISYIKFSFKRVCSRTRLELFVVRFGGWNVLGVSVVVGVWIRSFGVRILRQSQNFDSDWE